MMCIEYHIQVNIVYHVSAQGVDDRMINVHCTGPSWKLSLKLKLKQNNKHGHLF